MAPRKTGYSLLFSSQTDIAHWSRCCRVQALQIQAYSTRQSSASAMAAVGFGCGAAIASATRVTDAGVVSERPASGPVLRLGPSIPCAPVVPTLYSRLMNGMACSVIDPTIAALGASAIPEMNKFASALGGPQFPFPAPGKHSYLMSHPHTYE
jgi:hypothetical protein